MNTEGTGFYTCKECHTTKSLSKHTTIIHKEREQLGDQRNVGESSCNSGDRKGQMAQPLMFMMMMKYLLHRDTGVYIGSKSHSFIHSFIYSHSIDHTDVEFVIKYKYKQATIYKYKYNFR